MQIPLWALSKISVQNLPHSFQAANILSNELNHYWLTILSENISCCLVIGSNLWI